MKPRSARRRRKDGGYATAGEDDYRAARLGPPVPHVFVRLDAGEILVKSPYLMSRYFHGFCEGKIASYKQPRQLVIVNDIPRTPTTGQIQRRLLAMPERADHSVPA